MICREISIDRLSQLWESPRVVVDSANLFFEVVGEDLKLIPGISSLRTISRDSKLNRTSTQFLNNDTTMHHEVKSVNDKAFFRSAD